MSKTFAQAPKPKPLTDEVISAFERGGTGQDTQTHITTNVGKMVPTNTVKMVTTNVVNQEPIRRLSIDLPESLHRRFKTACSKADKKMLTEVTDFIKQRTAELENE
jgi:hypothetical protein